MKIIHQLRMPLIFILEGLALIFLALPSKASFKRLLRDDELRPKNETFKCKKEVRARILSLLAHDNISFDCDNGLIKQLCVHETSPINTDWKFFIANNPMLFGMQENEFRFHETNGRLDLMQTWRGVHIRSTRIWWSNLSIKGNKLTCIHPYTVDTSNWDLEVKPFISSTTAAATVLKQCENSSCEAPRKTPRETPQITTWSKLVEWLTAEKPYLSHEITPPKKPSCKITEIATKISQSSISSIPTLIWEVSGSRHCQDCKDVFSCDIDAHTGLPVLGSCRF